MVVFSGYWKVDNNPKASAKKGHIDHLKKKKIDLLFCDKKYGIINNEVIIDLPVKDLVKDFTGECYTKFGQKINAETMTDLCKIWCSKILLFKEAMDLYPKENEFVWVDCVSETNFDKIINVKSDNIVINKYTKMYKNPFNGKVAIDFKNLKVHLLAQVIKINRTNIISIIEKYIHTLKWVNETYNVYDEEVVLTHMYHKYPDLFEIVN